MKTQLGLAAHLSRWLAGLGLDAMALTPSMVDRYVMARRGAGYRTFRFERIVEVEYVTVDR